MSSKKSSPSYSIYAKLKKKKNKENVPEQTQQAIWKLRETEKLLEKKQEYLEQRIEIETNTAKANVKKNKRIALQALKRKKRLEKQLSQIDGTLSTIEFQRDALENSSTNTEVVKSMSFAANALKEVHKTLDIDDVHDVMDDVQEQAQLSDEISQAINFVGSQDIDESDIMSELAELEQEVIDKELIHVKKPGPRLPNVPSTKLPAAQKKKRSDEDELKELEAWLA
ncbi:charged multivesicular body protein 4b [Nematostella vectensis]|uniref:charged multivesicular body protein 4b n=1 Tax=Nematostella vectensis TaxID=45351 RepID=UPI0020777F5F|nr:charged multivesicular body protein 4b [Nematostella vectensis]